MDIHNIFIPFLGQVDFSNFSLIGITALFGLIDGFNPCAMWALLLLLGLLLGLKDNKKIWIFGLAFILTSGVVYFIFMSAWLNFFIFLNFVPLVRIIIGALAIFSGAYYLRDFFINKNPTCKVTNSKQKSSIIEKMKYFLSQNNFWLPLIGIILLAVVINLTEAICSAGLPAIYTQLLSLQNLPTAKYYLYLLLYLIFFMLDDVIIFTIVIKSLKFTTLNKKYDKFSKIIGGILLLIIGLLLFFKPEYLSFTI